MSALQERPLAPHHTLEYWNVHRWLRRTYGKADHCSLDRSHQGKRFEWANIDGVYERDRKHFRQLCRSCHVKLDIRSSTRQKLAANVRRQIGSRGRPVAKYSLDGRLLDAYRSIRIASEENGVTSRALNKYLKGRQKVCGGFRWEYVEVPGRG